MHNIRTCFLVILLSFSALSSAAEQQKRPLTIPDIMKFREIKDLTLSDNGLWMAYSEVPDRGDSSGHIKSTDGKHTIDIPLAKKASLSKDGKWAAFMTSASLLTMETASKEEKKALKDGAVIVNTTTGDKTTFENVKSITFSGNSRYALIHFGKSTEEEEPKEEATKEESENKEEAPAEKPTAEEDKTEHFLKDDKLGTPASLIELATGEITPLDQVQKALFAENGDYFAYVSVDKDGENNKLTVVDTGDMSSTTLDATVLASYPHMQWNEEGTALAFLKGSYEQKATLREHGLYLYKTKSSKATLIKTKQKNRFVSHDNHLSWSRDGKRLFFGQKATQESVETNDKVETEEDLFNVEKLVAGKELQVWHGDDPRIKPHAAKEYEDDQKYTHLNVVHLRNNKVVALTDETLTWAESTNNSKAVLAVDERPYRKQITWQGFYADFYHVELKTGEKTLITEKITFRDAGDAMLSPNGRYVTYFHKSAVWMFDSKKKSTINLTKDLPVSFADELHDYPSPESGYGIGGWLADDSGVLVYDRYDVWLFTKNGKGKMLTQGDGRKREVVYRVLKTDKEQDYYDSEQTLLLSAYYDRMKNFGFYQLALDDGKLTSLLEDNKKYRFLQKAKDSDTILFTQEDMHEFPDIWVTNSAFSSPQKLTNVNPQIDEFLWGTPELVEWQSTAGKSLQGILIKPANYQEDKRYPVLVYYYRYFSQRLYEFNQMKVNHRPNFPFYHSNGYAVFLPDIKFDIGLPGPSATQALVPGVQKLVDMGVADPDAIGLHGHSWSGYQTAFAITQTNVFKAAVAGAPVANMTSAYGGIRLGSGLLRAFQYEAGQSRIGGDLIDDLNLYIENSPLFFADRINTPLLIQFGDVDDAVPWQQGVEMYTIMRRLDKPVIMLQYEGEPHHLKKYPNKVDYTIKMKQFFDHHLRGEPAPVWMTEGVAYSEKDKD